MCAYVCVRERGVERSREGAQYERPVAVVEAFLGAQCALSIAV